MKMKSNAFRHRLKPYWVLGLFFLSIVLSCKRDSILPSKEPDDPKTKKLFEWYQSKLIVSGENPFGKMKPRWSSLYVNENSSQRVYEVELDNPERVLAKLGRPDRATLGREEKRHMIRLLIFENRLTGKILYASYMSAESGAGTVSKDFHYKDVGAFSGTVLFYHFSGMLSNGWSYENGKITRQITAISKSDFDLLSQSGPKGKLMSLVTTCSSGYAEKFRWSCVGVAGYENCGWISAGYEYVTVCTTREASDVPNTEEDGGTSGDYFPPIYVDCAGVENGSAYWNTDCKTCMGGTTGITECAVNVEDPGDKYELLVNVDSIRLVQRLDCFNSVPDNSATVYSAKLYAELPDKDRPEALLNSQLQPGHSFITLTKTNGTTTVSETFGFYPESAVKASSQFPVKSMVVDNQNHDYHASLSMNVNANQFTAMMNMAVTQAKNKYDMTGYNCTTYALSVFNQGRATALYVPDTMGSLTGRNYGKTPNGLYEIISNMQANSVSGANVGFGKGTVSTKCN